MLFFIDTQEQKYKYRIGVDSQVVYTLTYVRMIVDVTSHLSKLTRKCTA
jgi:predicted RNase H-related nuclease YkuK (DUF458 family)